MNLNLIEKVYAVSTEISDPLVDSDITTLANLFGLLINIAIGVGVALTIIFLILGGIQYITSKGDQKAAQTARDWLTNAVIGFIIVIGAITIRVIVLNLIGAADTTPTITDVTPIGV